MLAPPCPLSARRRFILTTAQLFASNPLSDRSAPFMISSGSVPDPSKSGREVFEDVNGPAPGKFLDTTHGTTHYVLEGPSDAPLVVLQHGIGGHLGVFDRIASDLLDKNFRVLRYDFYDRGYSESDPRKYPITEVGVHPLAFTLGLYLEQFRDVLSGLGMTDTPFAHCGHSNGGVVGIGYAAARPSQVRGLALIDSVCLPVSKPLPARVADLPVVGGWVVRNLGIGAFVKFSRGSCADPDGNEEVAAFLDGQERCLRENPRFFAAVRSTSGSCAGFVGSAEPQFRACCSGMVPMRLIWGRDDASVPYSDCRRMRDIAEELGTEVTEESFEGMPHNVFFADARPEECSRSIGDFVSGLRSQDEYKRSG